MFITVDGFNKTGIPGALWEFVEPYAKIDHVSGVAVLAAVVVVLSNVASNVPTGKPRDHYVTTDILFRVVFIFYLARLKVDLLKSLQ